MNSYNKYQLRSPFILSPHTQYQRVSQKRYYRNRRLFGATVHRLNHQLPATLVSGKCILVVSPASLRWENQVLVRIFFFYVVTLFWDTLSILFPLPSTEGLASCFPAGSIVLRKASSIFEDMPHFFFPIYIPFFQDMLFLSDMSHFFLQINILFSALF